ncbi:hypothetical protein EW145_g8129, partial [Phellinidium pouzarii]
MSSSIVGSRDAVLQTFSAFGAELDEHNDRRERLVKKSRDITILSKKIIFLLHRLVSDTALCGSSAQTSVADAVSQGRKKLAEVQALFRGMRADLAGERIWRYQSSVSPGLQEYIEALAFAHYLEHDALITLVEVQASLSDEHGVYFPLALEEYLLGVSDLTGELMRFAITAIARRGGRTKAREVSAFVRNCKAAHGGHCKTDFDGFTPYVKHLDKKQAVTTQSLLKIEDAAAYATAVRASEYADREDMDMDMDMVEDVVGRCVEHTDEDVIRTNVATLLSQIKGEDVDEDEGVDSSQAASPSSSSSSLVFTSLVVSSLVSPAPTPTPTPTPTPATSFAYSSRSQVDQLRATATATATHRLTLCFPLLFASLKPSIAFLFSTSLSLSLSLFVSFVSRTAFNSQMALSSTSLAVTVAHAVTYLTRPLATAIPVPALAKLQATLEANLAAAYLATWMPSDPARGSGRRILSFSPDALPPRPVYNACASAGVDWTQWSRLLGGYEFDLLVDPG